MKILKIFLIVAAFVFVWLIFALVRTTLKTVAERKNRPPRVQTQQQVQPSTSDIDDRRYNR